MDHRYDNLHLASTKRADFLYFSSWKSSDNFPQKKIFFRAKWKLSLITPENLTYNECSAARDDKCLLVVEVKVYNGSQAGKVTIFYERRHEQLTVCCFFLQSSLTLGSQGMIFP